MDTPRLKITPEAKGELLRLLGHSGLDSPIVALGWSVGRTAGWIDDDGREHIEAYGPGWDVGFYEASRIPNTEIRSIDGLPFCFGQPMKITERLNGAILHFSNGQFTVTENAI